MPIATTYLIYLAINISCYYIQAYTVLFAFWASIFWGFMTLKARHIKMRAVLRVCAELPCLHCMWRKSWPHGLSRAPGREPGSRFLKLHHSAGTSGCKRPCSQASLTGTTSGAEVAVVLTVTRPNRRIHQGSSNLFMFSLSLGANLAECNNTVYFSCVWLGHWPLMSHVRMVI